MTGGTCVTQDKAGPGMRAYTHTRTRTHKWPCIAADSRTVCGASSAPRPACQKKKKSKTSRAKSDLTFSNTESAEKAGERDAERRERDGEAEEVEGAGPRHERPPTEEDIHLSRPSIPLTPPTPPQPHRATRAHGINLMSLYIIIKASPLNDTLHPFSTQGGLIISINQ